MYINIPGIRIHRGIINGYRCPISGREFASEDGSKSTDDRLRQEQEQHTQQIQHDMDLWRPTLGTADNYKNQYAEFLAAAGDETARQLAADQDTAQQEESNRDAARQEANREAFLNKGQK